MPYRQFTDSRGIGWEVWNVDPQHAERRLGAADRRRVRRGPDRRQRPSLEARVRLSRPELTLGWLTFEAKHEKRRLSPIPDGWERFDDAALEQLLNAAIPAGKPRRLLE
jgi:hypothetical protein